MNRRGFFGLLAALPLARLLPKSRPYEFVTLYGPALYQPKLVSYGSWESDHMLRQRVMLKMLKDRGRLSFNVGPTNTPLATDDRYWISKSSPPAPFSYL
jgi:hypothetical protein